jgi:hypothetical protein
MSLCYAGLNNNARSVNWAFVVSTLEVERAEDLDGAPLDLKQRSPGARRDRKMSWSATHSYRCMVIDAA